LKEEHALQLSENEVLRKILGHTLSEQVNEELRDLYTSHSTGRCGGGGRGDRVARNNLVPPLKLLC